jgi:Fe-S-cluster containining protein
MRVAKVKHLPQTADPFVALKQVYAEVEAALSPFDCDASTDCCRFGVTGREPYVTWIELAYLARAAPFAFGATSSKASQRAARRELKVLARGGGGDVERRCPVLGADGRCRAYAHRPLGCRTFFCERVGFRTEQIREAVAPADHPDRTLRGQYLHWARVVLELSEATAPSHASQKGTRPLTRALLEPADTYAVARTRGRN